MKRDINLQLELGDHIGWQGQGQVQQLTHTQVQLQPGRVVVSVQSVPQVSPARVQGSNPSDLSSKINKNMSAIILSKLNRKIKLEFSMTTLKSLYQKNYHLLIYR